MWLLSGLCSHPGSLQLFPAALLYPGACLEPAFEVCAAARLHGYYGENAQMDGASSGVLGSGGRERERLRERWIIR